MTPAIERAARAVGFKLGQRDNERLLDSEEYRHARDWHEAIARAVLQSLLPPTKEMIEAAEDEAMRLAVAHFVPAGTYDAAIFTAMINTALQQ